jgi:hypothetical protein
MKGGPSPGETSEAHPFICRGCRVRYAHAGQCLLCASEIIPLADWTEPPAPRFVPPDVKSHKVLALISLATVAVSIPLAWGAVTLWGVVLSGLLTIALLFVPATKGDPDAFAPRGVSGFVRGAPPDKQGVPWGTSPDLSIVAVGVAAGIVAPLVTILWDQPTTIAAGLAAATGCVVAYVRRALRRVERAAGWGVAH